MNKINSLKNDPRAYETELRKRVEASVKPERFQSDDSKKTLIKRMAIIPVTGLEKKEPHWKYIHNKDPKMK
jgi:hypothetical protein